MKHHTRTILRHALTGAAALALAACTQHEIIPDRTLARIFHDAFLTNAYIDNRGMAVDSLDIYQPIFESYGYTAEDVRYTIGNFSKRKSSRLSDVVETAIKQLEEEGLRLEHETAVLDTVSNIARRRFTRTLYRDSLVHITRIKDTAALTIVLDNVLPGEYRVTFDYKVDTTDTWSARRYAMWFERADSSRFNRQQYSLRTGTGENISRTAVTSDTSVRRFVVRLLEVTPPSGPQAQRDREINRKRTDVTYRNIRIVHIPEAAAATDSLFVQQAEMRIFAESFTRLFGPQNAYDAITAEGAAEGTTEDVTEGVTEDVAAEGAAEDCSEKAEDSSK